MDIIDEIDWQSEIDFIKSNLQGNRQNWPNQPKRGENGKIDQKKFTKLTTLIESRKSTMRSTYWLYRWKINIDSHWINDITQLKDQPDNKKNIDANVKIDNKNMTIDRFDIIRQNESKQIRFESTKTKRLTRLTNLRWNSDSPQLDQVVKHG